MKAARDRRAVCLLVAVLLAGCSGAAPHAEDHPDEPAPPIARASTPTPHETITSASPPGPVGDLGPVKRFRSVRGTDKPSRPSAVTIPAVGIQSPLLTLGRASDGSIEVPGDFQRAGWYREGPVPGQPGPAVILGHVDSRQGPAVFYRLRDLEPGDEVVIDRADGSSVRFVVDRVERYDKDAFPTYTVYYPTLDATLRLITCGGTFDPSARSYRDNIIVFATYTPEGAAQTH